MRSLFLGGGRGKGEGGRFRGERERGKWDAPDDHPKYIGVRKGDFESVQNRAVNLNWASVEPLNLNWASVEPLYLNWASV